jgi:hypothetical protein
MTQQTLNGSARRKLFGSMKQAILGNKKIPIDIRRGSIAIVVNIALWGSSWALKEAI